MQTLKLMPPLSPYKPTSVPAAQTPLFGIDLLLSAKNHSTHPNVHSGISSGCVMSVRGNIEKPSPPNVCPTVPDEITCWRSITDSLFSSSLSAFSSILRSEGRIPPGRCSRNSRHDAASDIEVPLSLASSSAEEELEECNSVNEEVLSVGCDSPPPVAVDRNCTVTPDVGQYRNRQGLLKFGIDNILKPEFGDYRSRERRRSEESTFGYRPNSCASTPSVTSTSSSCYRDSSSPIDLSKECIKSTSNQSAKSVCEKVDEEAQSFSSDTDVHGRLLGTNKKEDSNGMIWPAWVYCTRYSDRPSSGIASTEDDRSE